MLGTLIVLLLLTCLLEIFSNTKEFPSFDSWRRKLDDLRADLLTNRELICYVFHGKSSKFLFCDADCAKICNPFLKQMFVNNSRDIDWNILLVLNNVHVEKYKQIVKLSWL